MNKYILLIALGLFFSLSTEALAQQNGTRSKEIVDHVTSLVDKSLTKELNLTDKQRTALINAYLNTSINKDPEGKKLRNLIKSILTPEQHKKYIKITTLSDID